MTDVSVKEVFAEQLDYKKYPLHTPKYKYSKILPQSGSQDATLTTAAGTSTVFEWPNKVYNLARSYLTCTVTYPDDGTKHCYTQVDCLNLIRQVLFTSRGGVELTGNLQEVGNYTKMIWKPELKFEDYKNYDLFTHNAGFCKYLRPNNDVVSNAATKTPANGSASVNYDEPLYYLEKDAGASLVLKVKIPLGMILNTIYAVDKDIYFNEVMITTINWAPSTKIYWLGTAAAASPNPTTGAAIADKSVTLSNLALYAAVEVDPEVELSVRNEFLTKGLNLMVPVVHYNKQLLSGTTQAVSLRYNRAHGERLVKIYHSLFRSSESSNTMYDNQNVAQAKVTDFYTMLDNIRLQEFSISCANGDDYMIMSEKCKGSILLSSEVYNNSWVWKEEFGDLITPLDKPTHPDEMNLIRGLDLNSEKKWDIYLNVVNASYNHYTYAVCLRNLVINAAGISFI